MLVLREDPGAAEEPRLVLRTTAVDSGLLGSLAAEGSGFTDEAVDFPTVGLLPGCKEADVVLGLDGGSGLERDSGLGLG